jgi:hypothetical protein
MLRTKFLVGLRLKAYIRCCWMFDEDRMSERKTAKIITRVTEDDRSWLQQEADTLGVDLSTLVRMTLRRERNECDAARRLQAVA